MFLVLHISGQSVIVTLNIKIYHKSCLKRRYVHICLIPRKFSDCQNGIPSRTDGDPNCCSSNENRAAYGSSN